MRQIWNDPLSLEILLILIVKIALLFAIWWVFFHASDTPPSPEQVSRALLESRPAIERHTE